MVSGERLGLSVCDWGTNRKTRARSEVDGVEKLPGTEDRADRPALAPAEGLGRIDDCAVLELFELERVSLRRAIKRSDSDSRDDQVDSGRLDEKVRCPMPGFPAGGATLGTLSAPIRLPIFGREA